ncbi:High-affinity nickel transporter [Nannocystaceae bacterium ST9]
MLAALTGALLGAWHVVSGPDHLAAIAPLATSSSRTHSPWRAGLAWGLGHASGVWLVGLLLLAFGALLPLEALGVWSERLVGLLIVGVGVWGLWRVRHPHDHDHDHAHTRGPAFVIGAVHGLAGSSHLYGVLPALALDEGQRVGYLIAFGIGSVLAMACFSSLLALLVERLPGSRDVVRTWALRVASIAAVVIGAAWLVFGG